MPSRQTYGRMLSDLLTKAVLASHSATDRTLFNSSRVETSKLPSIKMYTPSAAPWMSSSPLLYLERRAPSGANVLVVAFPLGLSPEHASSVCLVLLLTIGLVSAQFHVRADKHFETVGSSFNGVSPQSNAYQSHWQENMGLALTVKTTHVRVKFTLHVHPTSHYRVSKPGLVHHRSARHLDETQPSGTGTGPLHQPSTTTRRPHASAYSAPS